MTIRPSPNPPIGLSATIVSTTQIALSWLHDGLNISEFRIDRSRNEPSGFATLGTASPEHRLYVDVDLEANETYFYRVLASYGVRSAVSIVVTVTT